MTRIQRRDDRLPTNVNGRSRIALAIASVLLLSQAAHAGEAPAALEEIIVTAERRAVSENETPISMNVLTGDDLAETRTQFISDLQNTTPNVTINQAGLFNSINIRGIGNSVFSPAITTGVAVFQDGLLNAETATLSGGFLDLATIEILRGPQGTFVGSSSTGGAIRLNSVAPSLDGGVSGYAEALVGTKSDMKFTGAINLPISNTWAARLAFNNETRDSYFYNRQTVSTFTNPYNQPGSLRETNARVSLLWRPNDSFEAIFRAEGNRSDHNGSPFQPNPRLFTNTLGVLTHSRFWNYDDPGHDPEVLSINRPDTQDYQVADRYSLDARWTFDNGMQLRSLTGMVHNETRVVEDLDGSSAQSNVIRNNIGPDNDYYIQEFNLVSPQGPVNWVLGTSAFYRMTRPNASVEEFQVPNPPGPPTTCGIDAATGVFRACQPEFPVAGFPGSFPALTLLNNASYARAYGVFGQLNWQFTDSLELTTGARMNYDRNFAKNLNGVKVIIPAPPGAVPGFFTCPANVQGTPQVAQLNAAGIPYSCLQIGVNGSFKDETPTWKLGLNWSPGGKGGDHLVYAFWSRGYKSGGFDQVGEFGPETVDNYELGWKGTFADGRAQLSFGGFWMDYQDYQASAFQATPFRAVAAPANVGEATIKGLEAEFNGRFGGLGINASVGYTDSELGSMRFIDRQRALDSAVRAPGSSQDLGQCVGGAVFPACADWTPYYVTVSGQSNVFSPELSYNVTVDYAFGVGSGSLTPRVNYSHIDEQDTNLLRREAYYSLEERDLLNVSLTYAQGDWLVQAYCNNCSDEQYITGIDFLGGNSQSVMYGNPRNLGLRLRRTF